MTARMATATGTGSRRRKRLIVGRCGCDVHGVSLASSGRTCLQHGAYRRCRPVSVRPHTQAAYVRLRTDAARRLPDSPCVVARLSSTPLPAGRGGLGHAQHLQEKSMNASLENRAGRRRPGRRHAGDRPGHLLRARRIRRPFLHLGRPDPRFRARRVQRPRLVGRRPARPLGSLRGRPVRRPVRDPAPGPLSLAVGAGPERPHFIGARRERERALRRQPLCARPRPGLRQPPAPQREAVRGERDLRARDPRPARAALLDRARAGHPGAQRRQRARRGRRRPDRGCPRPPGRQRPRQ